MENIVIYSECDMLNLGYLLGELAKPGDLLFLFGELGAGKTTLTKGIAQGMGVSDLITSPTFQIQKNYQGRYPLCHLDLYRLQNPAELDVLDLDEILDQGVAVVEWGGLLRRRLQSSHLEIKIDFIPPNINARSVSIIPHGPEYNRYLTTRRSMADVNFRN
ncbi:MAG: tRNA (adenosine(37)-N6)-threonylcarbamoyltransferase complex ATPase subunit type 1 TsaE [Firmicutes bacterium]|nr:tRNA (adenosine(37)-N6)-threonylcarbamoyltransferase complex ATPase subunit type 1 TsaE [Bacillota bacterium]